jgi:hypothetical protein
MKSKDKLTLSERFVLKLASPVTWVFVLGLAVIMSIGIIIFSDEFTFGKINPSSQGWENFWNYFKAPISVFVGGQLFMEF